MPEEHAQTDETEDEMPVSGGAPCGDVFARPDTAYVTDADDESAGRDQD
jgi:hypothetical protein